MHGSHLHMDSSAFLGMIVSHSSAMDWAKGQRGSKETPQHSGVETILQEQSLHKNNEHFAPKPWSPSVP